jgi:hypothetical protein
MEFTFDVDKDARNRLKHGLGLAEAILLDWSTALIWQDSRRDYGECRLVALALLDCRVHCVVYVERGAKCRIISLRKANYREAVHYVQATTHHPADS